MPPVRGGPDLDPFTYHHAADTHGPKQALMAGIDQHVNTPFVHGNGHHARCLATVEYKKGIGLAYKFANRARILQRAGHIGRVIDDDESGIGLDAPANFVRVYKTGAVGTNTGYRHIVVPLVVIGWAQYTVVLHPGDDHMVARVQHACQGCIH